MTDTLFRSTLQADAPLVQDADYRFDGADRQKIDQQIVDIQTLVALALLNGVTGTYALIATTSADIAKGDVLCRAATTTLQLTKATAAAIAVAGGVFGAALSAAAHGARCPVALAGAIGPDITGLALSAAGHVRVSSAGRCERVVALGPGDYALGVVDALGWLTMASSPGVTGGAASVTFNDVKSALAGADTAVDFNGQELTGLATPTAGDSAATKDYVDGAYTDGDGITITDGSVAVDYAASGVISAVNAGDVAFAGVANTSARGDHEHAVSTSAPLAIAIGDTQSAGSSTALAKSDHVHEVPAPAAPANVTKAAASAGVATTFARADHKHDVSTAVTGAIAIGDAAAEGSDTSLARSDHVHSVAAPAAPENVTKAAASAGAATTFARADHKHDVTTDNVETIGSANSEGTATSLARSDHVHDAGNIGSYNMFFGAATLPLTTSSFLTPGYLGAVAPANEVQLPVSKALTVTTILYRPRSVGSGAGNIIFIVRKNGVDTALTLTVAANAASGTATGSATFDPDTDTISIKNTLSANLDSTPEDPIITLGCTSQP
jgi:hypothetical protein